MLLHTLFGVSILSSGASAAYLTARATPASPATSTSADAAAPAVTSFQPTITSATASFISSSLDPWQCYTQNISTFFDLPTPEGTFLTAFQTYAQDLVKDCTNQGTPIYSCPFPSQTSWCAYTTAAPQSLRSEWASYGSVASTWWAAHSSAVVDTADYCPRRWADAGLLANFQWMNVTIAMAGCQDEINREANTTDTYGAPQTAGPPGSLSSSTSVSQEPVSSNAARPLANPIDMGIVAGPAFAAFVAAYNQVA